jgi:hypothetical protein
MDKILKGCTSMFVELAIRREVLFHGARTAVRLEGVVLATRGMCACNVLAASETIRRCFRVVTIKVAWWW